MNKLLTFVLAAMAFVACTQNEVEELTANRADAPETLTIGFEGGDTRIELNNALKSVWSKGDEVSVFYRSYENLRYAYNGETGERMGELTHVSGNRGEQSMDNIIVVYPYNAEYLVNLGNGGVEASLPAVQSYKEGSYGAEGNIMVAESEFTQFVLKSVCGWLRVELTGEGESVKAITLRGNDGEQVAGLCYIDCTTATATLATEIGEASDEEQVGGVGGGLEFDDAVFTEVTLNCGSGVELDSEAKAFYIGLLPQTFESGVTIEVDCAGYKPMTLSTESSITIERNHIKPMAAVEHDAGVILPSNELWYTATALVEPYDATAFNVAIVSNEWDETTGEGVITFDGELTTIGYEAFSYCESLTSVTIPDSVTTIGDRAFSICNSLTSVTIPDSVMTIGKRAFSYCHSLTSVTIGDSVTTIGYMAFYDCESLTSVTIPDSVTTIGDEAFYGCSSLTSVTIPDSVTTIGDEAFRYCRSLTSVTIPDSVTTIGYGAFSYCDSLTSVTIPDSVTTIGDRAFLDCESLAEFNGKFAADSGRCLIIDGVLNAFALGCGVTEYTISDSVTTIGEMAFWYCNSLTSVTIPDSVTTIGNSAFENCSSLAEFKGKFAADGGRCLIKDNTIIAYANASGTTYTIPDSVTTIGYKAFSGCYSRTSVTIPESVTAIGYMAFDYCYSLTSVYCKATTPPTLDGSYVFDRNKSGRKIYAPAESVEAYKAAENWSKYAADIVGYNFETGEEVTISNKLFYTATALVEPNTSAFNVAIASNEWDETTGEGVITFDGELTTIGVGAFYWCSSLTSVTIPDSVTTIGNNAFYWSSSLTSVTIGDSVTTIGASAFENCISLTSVTIGDSVTTIGEDAFLLCSSLTSVTIPDSVTTIGVDAFGCCESLTEFKGKFATEDGRCLVVNGELCAFAPAGIKDYIIPDSVTTIGYMAFGGCKELTSVTIPNSVTTIGYMAFYNCSSLTSVTIPDSVTTIGETPFKGCSNLAKFNGKFAAEDGCCLIVDGVLNTFAMGCDATEYVVPDSAATIGVDAFYHCNSLTSVTIPDSVTTIGDYAFRGCDSLTSVTIPDSVTTIGVGAFYYCRGLISVTIGNSVTTIGQAAFHGCSSLAEFKGKFAADGGRCLIKDNAIIVYAEASGTTYTIPDSVTSIGNSAFKNCSSLTSVTIPDSVTSIGFGAFWYCNSLTSVYCEATTPPTLDGSYVFDSNKSGRKIYVPAESVEAYKSAAGWSEYASYIVGYNFE